MEKHIKNLVKKLKKNGVNAEVLSSSNRKLLKLKFRNRVAYIVGECLPIGNPYNIKITIDKNLTKRILKKVGISVPRGFLVSSFNEVSLAIKNKKIKFPLVIKPNDGTVGRGVIANIITNDELKKSILLIKKQNYIPFLVEECFRGDDFRFLVLKGKVIAVAKRIPPFVIGDGRKILRKLISDLNTKKEKKIIIDDELFRNIKKQKLSLESVIFAGREVRLRENANIGTGGFAKNTTKIVNKKFKDIAIKAANELGLDFAGVDIIANDITKNDSEYVLTEVNSIIAWELHEKVDIGENLDIATMLAKTIKEEMKNELPRSKAGGIPSGEFDSAKAPARLERRSSSQQS